MKKNQYNRYLEQAAKWRSEIKRLFAGGMIQAEIARQLGMTRARVNQVVKAAQ